MGPHCDPSDVDPYLKENFGQDEKPHFKGTMPHRYEWEDGVKACVYCGKKED